MVVDDVSSAGAASDQNSVVDAILAAARAVLESPRLLPDDNFFDAGLDSVLAVELADQLTGTIGTEFPVAFLYAHPTAVEVAELARDLSGDQDDAARIR